MENGDDTLHLNTPFGVVGTSRCTNQKKYPVWNVTLCIGDLTLWIHVTLMNLESTVPGSPQCVSDFRSTRTIGTIRRLSFVVSFI